jgi:Family of unknown function (DUF5995)
MPVKTIDEVIAQLDDIIASAIANQSRLGLFAALYRQVTLKVKQGIAAGAFEDGPRMTTLDATFASRYLDALATWEAGGATSQCWQLAFDDCQRTDLILIQYLLLGMNAHINLDLGVAAATVCPGPALAGLHTDFDRINQILAALVDRVKQVLAEFSPLMHLLGTGGPLGDKLEDELVNFSMTEARDDAWRHAQLLAPLPAAAQAGVISVLDDKAVFLGRLVADPGRLLTVVLDAIHLRESTDIPAVIRALDAIVPA